MYRTGAEGKAPIAVSGDNFYVAWWENGTRNTEVMFKASNDSGHTFRDKINISNYTNGTSIEAGVTTADENVYVTYWNNKTEIRKAYLRASTDDEQTFGPDVTLTGPIDYPVTSAQTKEQLDKLYPYELKSCSIRRIMSTSSLVAQRALTIYILLLIYSSNRQMIVDRLLGSRLI